MITTLNCFVCFFSRVKVEFKHVGKTAFTHRNLALDQEKSSFSDDSRLAESSSVELDEIDYIT